MVNLKRMDLPLSSELRKALNYRMLISTLGEILELRQLKTLLD
jgi:hypothetical protein